jgi:hypothetical protein
MLSINVPQEGGEENGLDSKGTLTDALGLSLYFSPESLGPPSGCAALLIIWDTIFTLLNILIRSKIY